MQTYKEVDEAIRACKRVCAEKGEPFHADALAAALGVSYTELCRLADGRGRVPKALRAAIQECTASVIGAALAADPKSHGLWMFYLRNRAAFSDKADKREQGVPPVVFTGEDGV